MIKNDDFSNDIDSQLAEAYEHLRQGRYRMALTAAQNIYKKRPNDFNIIICLAWALLENNNPAQALELANLSVQVGGNNINPRLYRGFFLMRMSIFEGAISDLDWVIAKNTELNTWAVLNKVRALAGLGNYSSALEVVESLIARNDSPTSDQIQIRDWLNKIIEHNNKNFKGTSSKAAIIMGEGEYAFKEKEFWFALWTSRFILNSPSLHRLHKQAHLLELETLFSMFQLRAAYDKAEVLKPLYFSDERFSNIYQKILKQQTHNYNPESRETSALTYDLRTDCEIMHSNLFNVIHAKTYDLMENLNTGKRTYLLQFNEESIRFIGVEVVIDNPFYTNKDVNINGMAIWYQNNIEVGRNEFGLEIQKDWKTVEFVQSWGTEIPGFWLRGQGKVEIFLDYQLICARWFAIDQSEIVNFEESILQNQQNDEPEKRNTSQPSEVRTSSAKPQETKSLEELLNELDSYIGLSEVKQSMSDFVDYLKFINERKKLGLKTLDELNVHSVFLGNPGTGKTTIARLLGKIFKAMGLLKNGHVIEVDRAGLVGQYIGETAQKTEKVINEALGGLLFIDEAYTLVKEGNQQDFGREAIDVLLKKMEDSAGEFVVITAGYPEEMNTFLNSNPGLKSRFTQYFNFNDYTPEELIKIFNLISEKEDYKIEDEAIKLLKKEFTQLYRRRDNTFGNARLVRNYFNEAKIRLSKRYLKIPEDERSKDTMTTICKEDVLDLTVNSQGSNINLGIDEEKLNEALDKLNSLTGLKTVKKEINEIVKLAKFYNEQGDNLQDKFNAHFLFLGNPGTGKTTVARLFSEIFAALGLLPKGHLVEIDRQGLVAGFVGQTAEKTKRVIDKAIGGTLFIDEAYTLIKKGDSNSDFGKEAVDTLLKRMEDDRGKFIVIAAGYTDDMNNFINSNPGLKSRFTKEIIFEDYTPSDLLQITKLSLEKRGHILDDETEPELKKHFNRIYRSRNKTFGNARIVRDLVESILKNQLLRIADIPSEERHEEVLKLILLEDIKNVIDVPKDDTKVSIEGDPELLDKYLDELSDLTGLESVKRSVEKLVSSLKVAKLRRERGLKVIPKNLHSVFMGNPGTGKTTIARLLSKIYKEMGVLQKGHLVEVDRSALVAGYQGQTATKTDDIINKAMGGTLFIDEAYALARGNSDFGQEAIDTLLKRMEDYQGKFIVIVAGYTNEMKKFVESNPGLQSRFTNYFSFQDYTPRQMLEIALLISKKNGYQLDEGAWQLMLDLFTDLYNKRDKNFGNARTVKNLLYNAISNQEERILTLYNPNDEDLMTIKFEDVDKINHDKL